MALSEKKIPGFTMTLFHMVTSKTFWAAMATIVTTATSAYEHKMAWSMALPIIFIAVGQLCQRDATQAQTEAAKASSSAE